MKRYIYSDLAFEQYDFVEKNTIRTKEYRCGRNREFSVFEMYIENEEQAKRIGRPCGKYFTVTSDKIWCLKQETFLSLRELLTNQILYLLSEHILEKGNRPTVLVVGLGNDSFVVDALGPRTVECVNATRHLLGSNGTINSTFSLAVMAPGVLAKTGMETVEQIRGIVQSIGADAVLAIDSLVASHYERIGTTVQLSDSGICPGSGIGNARKAITKETIGIPVIAIGIPTVIDAATMICDALTRGGIKKLTPKMEQAIENVRGHFVSPKESDLITQGTAILLTEAINALVE